MRRPLLLAVLALVVLVFAGSRTASPAVWHSLRAVSFAPLCLVSLGLPAGFPKILFTLHRESNWQLPVP
jgi:hypothetical protein